MPRFYRITRSLFLRLPLAASLALTYGQVVSMELLTEDDPPYSFMKNGQPDGFAVEVVGAIQKVLGTTDKISIQPWSRIYQRALTVPNVAVFTMTRTKDRDTLFYWVGPIVENDWVLVSKKSDGLGPLGSLEEAKKLRAIGTVRDYAWTHYLLDHGFTNLDSVTIRKQNSLKLIAGHIDAFVSADKSFKSELADNGLNPSDFEIISRFHSVQMYIALSKGTETKTVKDWQAAFDTIKQNGVFQTIHLKWFPNNRLPGSPRIAANQE